MYQDDHINPWQRLSSQQIYDNPWITVIEDQVIGPNQTRGIYGRVLFKNIAIGIIPIDKERNTWLVGQYRYALDEYSWEIPTGGGHMDVDILDSAKRELKEETGLTAQSWENIMRIHTSNSVTNEEGFLFVARDLTEGDTDFDDTEDLKVWKMPFDKAYEMVMNQTITDSLSIAGILKVKCLGL